MVRQMDKAIYEKITQNYEFDQVKEISFTPSFLIHFVLKGMALGFYLFKNTFSEHLFVQNENMIYIIIVIIIVVDFWMTKNVNGRQMIGLRWYFENDQYGSERFKFQCRANPELVSGTSSKLFWLILLTYAVLPLIFIVSAFLIVPNIEAVQGGTLFLNACFAVASISNIFFFFKASNAASERQAELRKEFGQDFVRRMENASIVSFL